MKTVNRSCLEVRHEGSSGYRHYLDGIAVHAGTLLEVWTDNSWLLGRYEWSFRHEREPYLVVNTDTDEVVVLHENAELRWPQ